MIHHLRKQALHLLSQRRARISSLRRTRALGGDLGDAIHQLNGGAESVVGALRVGLLQTQIALDLSVLRFVGAKLQQVADLIGRIRCHRDLQAGGDLLVCLRDALLDLIHSGEENLAGRADAGNHEFSYMATVMSR